MLETSDNEITSRPTEGPIVCLVCRDHALEQLEGIHLSARTVKEQHISKVAVYRCSHGHLFALFRQNQ
jgi:hypothetical protein